MEYNNDRIDAAVEAYKDLTPESIAKFRELNAVEAAIVSKVLSMSQKPKVGRPRRKKAEQKAS